MNKTIDIEYYTVNDEMPTMVFSGQKKSIVKLGRILCALAKCEYTKEVLRSLLGIKSGEKIKVFIKQAKTERNLQRMNGDPKVFDWVLTADKWKDFSSLLALFRSGKIDNPEIDPSYYSNLDVMITLGNRAAL